MTSTNANIHIGLNVVVTLFDFILTHTSYNHVSKWPNDPVGICWQDKSKDEESDNTPVAYMPKDLGIHYNC